MMVRDLFQFCFIQPFGSYLSRKLDIQGTRITGRKRKSPLAEGNETECLTSRCGINKDLTIRTKTTASTGPKRIPKPKPAVIVEAASPEVAEILSTMKKKRTMKRVKGNGSLASTYTVESVLENWSESTEYGAAFRNMTTEERLGEIVVLNKGAAKGMKGIIKSKLLVKHYKNLVADKLRDHIVSCRVNPAAMFHAAPKNVHLVTSDINFISVGEWVEVDADRTPGFNSEGGIAVIIHVHDALADVK